METDFLNFRDEEHFGTGLYQNDLLDDSQSSILDIVGDDYSRHDSGEYIDHSVIWEQDVERELNGDVAVIPMSGEINSFPKLSNSPPSKDFQKIFSDWQHFTAIETTPTEDLTADLHLPTQTLVGDMLDCFTPTPIPPPVPPFSPEPLLTTTFVPELPIITSIAIPTETIIPNFDFSTTTIPSTNPAKTFDLKTEPAEPEPQINIEKPLRKVGGGKNLELLKQVVKEEIDLDTSFKTEVTSSDELDSANDNFDITSYVNGDDFLLAQTSTFDESFEEADESESVKPISSVIKSEAQQYNRKYGGCYEKHMPMDNEDEDDSDEKDDKHEDSEEDCIDVETVSEQMPVLQARDLTSLLEQFEASEAVNPKLPQTLFDETTEDASKIKTEPPTCQLAEKNIKIETQSSQLSEKNTKVEPQLDKKLKTDPQCNQLPDKKHPTSINSKHKLKNGKSMVKNLSDELPIELIQKMKASGTKKQISVIPAMPARKQRANRNSDNSNKIKPVKTQQTGTESIHMDHDYCSMSPSRFPRHNSSDIDTSLKKFNSPDRKCDKIENVTKKSKDFDAGDNKKCLGALIDDTAIRIGKQIKNAIINENAKKQKMILTKPDLLKHQPKIKNADGKIMISLLKTNNRIANKFNCNTIVNTTNANDEQIKNIIVNDDDKRNAKKRKLNLEEYKKLRGDIIKTNSCESSRTNSPLNSGANSPMPVQNDKEKVVEEKYQDLIMKMASNILKTNAKSKHVPNDTTLENFIPPDQKPIKIEPKCEPLEIQKTPPKLPSEQFEIKTIVSIGVNTDEITIKPVIPEPKISFKLKKKELVKSKCFEKPSELEQNSPKIESNAKTSKLNKMITPILQNASSKINSNSLITNITATLLQQTPKLSSKSEQMIKIDAKTDSLALKVEVGEPLEHGEDKTVIILNKNSEKPQTKSIAVQTDPIIIEEITKEKVVRQYRSRRDSSASSTGSISSLKSKNATNIVRKSTTHRQNHRTSSTNSISSSLGSRWSRSRSRSSSQSDYSQSSYSSDSSRSKSRSVSPSRRWHTNRNSRSRHRYNRSRRRSRSTSYRGNYRRSRSPYSRSRSRLRRESVEHDRERERMREVEERRVIYVGKISSDTTKADLRRRFQNFGPITNVSCHFRDHGDNYGFVTFAYKVDAYEAVERGNDDPNVTKYDISFGGRRAFCKTRYSDLDNIEAEAMSTSPIFRREENSFDILLREVQAKLRKRKV